MAASHATSSTPTALAADALVVGIDMAKDKFDYARSNADRVWTLTNDSAGIQAIVAELLTDKPAMIVIESTGGFERPLLDALLDAGLPVALVHPGRVRHFAKALGLLAKTDRIDARVLARFGKLASPRLAEKRSTHLVELQALVVCRRQFAATRAQQQNRLDSTACKTAGKAIKKVIGCLDKQITALDKQIRELIDADEDFKHLDALLQTVPGVGPVLSATLAAELRELGETDRREVAALSGLAPYNHDSGRFSGKREIRGGRTAVRCVLYMATMAAIRFNPVIKIFSDRLKAAGKVTKVRIVACMRKLLTLLNAMARDGLQWNELNVVKKLAV